MNNLTIQRRAQPAGLRARLSHVALGLMCVLPGALAQSGAETPATRASSTVDPSSWPQPRLPLAPDQALEARITELMARMSVEEKVGQIVQGDISSVTPEDVRKYRLGSVLAGGNSDPGNDYRASAQDWIDLADAFYEASMDTSGGHNAIPVMFGIDAVHGHNNLVGATIFPHNIGLGATRNPELMREVAAATAVELRVTGLDWTFGPTLAVPQDDRWGRAYEGYSEDPGVVASYAGPLVEGLQGKATADDFLTGSRVVATAKHYVGDGGTTEGRDQGDARMSEQELREVQAAGYVPAIEAGVQTVMASFSSWNGVKLHGHKGLLTDVLKTRMGFDGFVVGDWNGHGQVDGCTNTDCPASFNAGVDMLMAPDSWKGYYESALGHVKSGVIPMERLDDAVRRILRVKMRAGMFEAGAPSARQHSGEQDLLGAPAHREVARRAVRESLVLLKNEGGVLPLDPGASILVAGDGADDIGKQSGGWTLTWQGTGLKAEDFPNGQSIWGGLKQQIEAAGGTATLSPEGDFEARPDVAIVVFGEEPYAEFQGDIQNVAYSPLDESDLQLLRKLKEQDIPVVSVFISGRPLWTNREINASDAFVAAWLPGSEGGGVADVLLRDAEGQVAHDFKGTLPFSWPRNAIQTPLNVGDEDYDPQFAFGYGLTYAAGGTVARLDEAPGIDLSASQSNRFLSRGVLSPGWTVRAGTAEAPVALDPASAASAGGISIDTIDHRAQEDAWQVSWTGSGRSSLGFVAPGPLDLTRETNGDVLLVMEMRVDSEQATDIDLVPECSEGCEGRVAVGAGLDALPRGEWTRVGVPLKCLQAGGTSMRALTVPVAIEAPQGTVLSLHEVGYGTEVDQVLDCAQ